MGKHNRILFLTLQVFSGTGGIEKVCRSVSKALFEGGLQHDFGFDIFSLHDRQTDAERNHYFPSERFRGFDKRKFAFVLQSLKKGRRYTRLVISHVSLLPVAALIKLLSPNTKVLMFAHGIEVWKIPLGYKKRLIRYCDKIICVSAFTRNRLISMGVAKEKDCVVLNNCLDPLLPLAQSREVSFTIRRDLGLTSSDKVLFTLSRLKSDERYKGYDNVIKAMGRLTHDFPGLKYVIAGKYDIEEKTYIDSLVEDFNLSGKVILTGYLPDESLPAYFGMADIFIMPSTQEGFGIAFIEAMYYGLPVIAGNRDGSSDALMNGALGLLTDPFDTEELSRAIRKVIMNTESFTPDPDKLNKAFGFVNYKKKLHRILSDTLYEHEVA